MPPRCRRGLLGMATGLAAQLVGIGLSAGSTARAVPGWALRAVQLARTGSAASALTQTSAQAAISDSDPCSGAHPRSQDRGCRDPGRSKAVPTLAPVRAITGVCGRLGDLLRREWCRSSPIIATGRRFDLPPVQELQDARDERYGATSRPRSPRGAGPSRSPELRLGAPQ